MAIKSKDIYKGQRKKHKAGKIIAWVCVIIVVLAIALFFILREFAVYDEYGNATIILPFTRSVAE
jgi:uncharacterized membrane protein YvbJ